MGGATTPEADTDVATKISIHAPRGGSDVNSADHVPLFRISIHAPRGGSDRQKITKKNRLAEFQSTLPVGGATLSDLLTAAHRLISIHAPRGGSDRQDGGQGNVPPISIHAPRGGSDPVLVLLFLLLSDFNPRSPWGERPRNYKYAK